jgi:hypothetical protein
MTETRIKGSGGPVPCLVAKGTDTADHVSKSKQITVCPDCGGALRFGSRDPCEGDAYWCDRCGCGPIWYPLGAGPRPVPAIIDAEQANKALLLVAQLRGRV